MDRLTELELFVLTAEVGTLSKAAEILGLSNAAASRHLVALEQRLNVRLIDRNTRRLALTHSGHQFYTSCKSLLGELKEAEASLSESLVQPVGTLTITSSISFCMLHIAPLIPAFRKMYPHINIKVLGENRYFDIIDSEVDLAIRTKEYEPDSNITIRRLAETRRVLAASPGYLKRKGTPRSIADLADHDLLIYSHANQPRVMRFTQGEQEIAYKVEPILETNDGQIVRAAALAGGGILVQPKYIINADLVAGRLIPVLDDWDLPRLTINMAFQSRRYMPAKLRVFIDFLLADFNERQYEGHWTR